MLNLNINNVKLKWFKGFNLSASNTLLFSGTLSLVESFIESEVPHLRLFLVKSMMPLKRWVATEKVLTALLGNEV